MDLHDPPASVSDIVIVPLRPELAPYLFISYVGTVKRSTEPD